MWNKSTSSSEFATRAVAREGRFDPRPTSMQYRIVRRQTWNVRARICSLIAACAMTLAAPSAYAAKKCQIAKIADLPITMNSLRPTIPVKINNRDAKFVLDSGAFYSIISSATAAEYNLKLTPTPFGFRVMGIGGFT